MRRFRLIARVKKCSKRRKLVKEIVQTIKRKLNRRCLEEEIEKIKEIGGLSREEVEGLADQITLKDTSVISEFLGLPDFDTDKMVVRVPVKRIVRKSLSRRGLEEDGAFMSEDEATYYIMLQVDERIARIIYQKNMRERLETGDPLIDKILREVFVHCVINNLTGGAHSAANGSTQQYVLLDEVISSWRLRPKGGYRIRSIRNNIRLVALRFVAEVSKTYESGQVLTMIEKRKPTMEEIINPETYRVEL